jgi:hypothetical protein
MLLDLGWIEPPDLDLLGRRPLPYQGRELCLDEQD